MIGLCSLVFAVAIHLSTGGLASTAVAGEPAAPAPANPAIVPGASEDLVNVEMTVLTVDPIKGELEASLIFEPKGIYKGGGPYSPSHNMVLRVNGLEKRDSDITFEAQKPMVVPSLKLNMVEGKASNYPFDRHVVSVFVGLTPEPSSKANDPFSLNLVPLVLKFTANVPGFDVNYQPAFDKTLKSTQENAVVAVAIDLAIVRSLSVKFFAVVVMLIMWVLAILTALVAIRVVRSGKQPDFGVLGWMGILLFAFPAIRNSQPAVPPIGTLSDFLSFFWAETIVAIALMTLAVYWLKRNAMIDR